MKSRETKRNASRLVNEWICVTGQYEKTLARISQELYKAYRNGLLSDQDAIDHCKVLDGIFSLIVQVLMGMGKFAKKSKHGQKVARLLNYNETVEKAKLIARFAGRPEEGILRVQMGFAPA